MRTGRMRAAEISLPAIRHNVGVIRKHASGAALIAVVKANGYGHGAADVARAAIEGGAAIIGVADLEEALALRAAGIHSPVLCWLHGVAVDFAAGVAARIDIGVSSLQQLNDLALAASSLGAGPSGGIAAIVHLKVDTGLSRNGAAPEDWQLFFSRAAELQAAGLIVVRGLFSHLANAGELGDMAQAARFDEAAAQLAACGVIPEYLHLSASAATLRRPQLHYSAVRVGMGIYGLSPFPEMTSAELGLIPAMTLVSQLVALRQVTAGTGVSYGFNHVCEEDTTLGLVPIGYADGMPRALNGAGATVLVHGVRCQIVGRIGMDQFIVDIGAVAELASLGDPVVLFGDPETGAPAIEEWAELMRTINYEIVVGIGARVVRVPVEGEFSVNATMQETVIEVADPDEMHTLGERLGAQLRAGDLVILTGPIGAGKTTLTRGIGAGLGVRGPVTSPTFVIARSHPSLVGRAPLVHVDAYRLANARELDDLDIDFAGSVVVAEWGSGLLDGRDSWLELVIERPMGAAELLDDGESVDGRGDDAPCETRTIRLAAHGPRWAEGISL